MELYFQSLICLHGVLLNEVEEMSSYCGTWLSTGTTMLLPLDNLFFYASEQKSKNLSSVCC